MSPEADDWFSTATAGSEMGHLVAATDWSSTPLGPHGAWSQALRIAVGTCLASRFPMLVVWGPELTEIYNDGYREILGGKHPHALGAPAKEIWPEIWDEIGPLFEQVLTTGGSTWHDNELLYIERRGFTEECYFVWSYSPIYDDDGSVGGVLDTVWETTEEVVGRRRLRCLGELSAGLVGAVDAPAIERRSLEVLGCYGADITSVDLRFGPRPDAEPGVAAVRAGPAWLVLGTSPFRQFDEAYRSFFALLGQAVGQALSDVERRSSVRRTAESLQQALLPPPISVPSVAVRYLPAGGDLVVGGDWYDAFRLADQVVLTVGDCVGHGVGSAAAMGKVRSAAKVLLLDGYGPARTLAGLDRFAESVPGVESTSICCLTVNPATGTGLFASAGLPPGAILRDGEVSWLLEGRNVPLAVPLPSPRVDASLQLVAGDVLVLYTDGLIERPGESLDDGFRRLAQALRQLSTDDPEEIADCLLEALLEEGPGRDDVALLVYLHP